MMATDGTTRRSVSSNFRRRPAKRPRMVDVESTNIARIGYDGTARRLYVEFRNGSAYYYDNVTITTYRELHDAESKGKYFHAAIRGRYPFTKYEVDDAAE